MLIETMKAAHLQARKAREAQTSLLLATIIGEAEMVGKSDGNRPTTEAEVLQVLRKFEKNLVDNIRLYGERRMSEALNVAEIELSIVRRFLPTKLTDLQVQKDIGTVMQQHNLPREQKSMGVVVKELKLKHGDQFDGQQVSAMFKQMLV